MYILYSILKKVIHEVKIMSSSEAHLVKKKVQQGLYKMERCCRWVRWLGTHLSKRLVQRLDAVARFLGIRQAHGPAVTWGGIENVAYIATQYGHYARTTQLVYMLKAMHL